MWEGHKLKYSTYSQNPALIIGYGHEDGNKKCVIRPQHLTPVFHPVSGTRCLLLRVTIQKGDDLDTIAQKLVDIRMVRRQEDCDEGVLAAIQSYCETCDGEKDNQSLECFSLRIRESALFQEVSVAGAKLNKATPYGDCPLMFLRPQFVTKSTKPLDLYWETLMDGCVDTIYPFYAKRLALTSTEPCVEYVKKLSMNHGKDEIPHPTWMLTKDSTPEEPKVASFPGADRFGKYGTNEDYLMGHSISLCRDFANLAKKGKDHFGDDKHHTIRVESCNNLQVIADVVVKRHEGATQPPMPSKSMVLKA
jgi:hypothetical protein